ncbi:hypothetical protein MMC25_004004 [Agyrium rufum]|nr:hypothetical protein [Agyrium rufum]
MAPPFIYFNGYPGVGKLTIATALSKLIPNSKVVNNHLLIDPVGAVYDRGDPEYQPMRKALVHPALLTLPTPFRTSFPICHSHRLTHMYVQRQLILNSIATSATAAPKTWIFTDQQDSDLIGSAAVQDYIDAAKVRGSRIISVILTCEVKENVRRLTSGTRGIPGVNEKLTDLAIFKQIVETEGIYHFGGETEIEVDVTTLKPDEAAKLVFEKIEGMPE